VSDSTPGSDEVVEQLSELTAESAAALVAISLWPETRGIKIFSDGDPVYFPKSHRVAEGYE